jgi:hypothetical protein
MEKFNSIKLKPISQITSFNQAYENWVILVLWANSWFEWPQTTSMLHRREAETVK